jgi:hypothetical protein
MLSAAREDWQPYLGELEIPSIESLDAFDRYWDRSRIAEAIRASDPSDFGNEYLFGSSSAGGPSISSSRRGPTGLRRMSHHRHQPNEKPDSGASAAVTE